MGHLLGLGINVRGNLWPLEVMFFPSFKSELLICKLAKFELIHAKRMRVARLDFAELVLVFLREHFEEAVLRMQGHASLRMLRELLHIDDRSRARS